MIRLFWVLIAVVALSWFALDLMLNRPVLVTNKDVKPGNTDKGQLKPSSHVVRKFGSLETLGKGQATGEPSHQFARVSTPKGLPLPSEEGPPELFTPSGFPFAELKEIDIPTIEDRLSESQLFESLRDPGYLLRNYIEGSGPTDLEVKENTEQGSDTHMATEEIEKIEMSDNEIEEELLKMTEFYSPEPNTLSADGDKFEDHISMTESGISIDVAAIDYNEIEERIYNSQLEEAQIPVY
jgi:hypothetical protein